MKKTFQLAQEGKKPDRLLEATKHEIRKYIKRERRRTLPEGVDYWDFDCRFGATQDDAAVAHLADQVSLLLPMSLETIEVLGFVGKLGAQFQKTLFGRAGLFHL